jgi:DNA modification methylase
VDGQIGLEKTPEEYVQHLVEVFREVRRVLRDDGTLWLNLGDSYYSTTKGSGGSSEIQDSNAGSRFNAGSLGLKEKDLVGIPWRVAFALQADGWYLRSDIIWSKPNPMPESVRDRPTKSHEYVFLLTKSPRYFFDQEAVREPQKPESASRYDYNFNAFDGGMETGAISRKNPIAKLDFNPAGRNIRSVWTITTKPYSEAHFATFPPSLPERCIKAGTSEKGCCAKCGAPWERVIEVDRTPTGMSRWDETEHEMSDKARMDTTHNRKNISGIFDYAVGAKRLTRGWQPTCECDADVAPCVVLDPFAGSGTTGEVARSLGRKAILIELNPEYAKLIDARCNASVPDIMEMTTEGKVRV